MVFPVTPKKGFSNSRLISPPKTAVQRFTLAFEPKLPQKLGEICLSPVLQNQKVSLFFLKF
jgi:hypothetical protein